MTRSSIRRKESDCSYNDFKTRLNNTVGYYKDMPRQALLFSGGADSRLLALLLKENGIDFTAYTARLIPYNSMNMKDVFYAERIANLCGINLKVVDVDTSKIDTDEVEKIIEYIPNNYHCAFAFIELLRVISQDNCSVVWTGQNADNLYNLGPSERFSFSTSGLQNLFQRMCLTEEFYKTYDEVQGCSLTMRLFKHTVFKLGKIYYEKKKCHEMYQPDNINEYIEYFLNSRDNTIFSKSKLKPCNNFVSISATDVTKYLIESRIHNYLRSGASLVIGAAAKSFGIKDVVCAYSSEYMIPFFCDNRLLFRDVLQPKKYIYQYISEFASKYGNAVKDFSDKGVKLDKNKYMSVHDFFVFVIEQTPFGQKINKDKLKFDKKSGLTGVQFFDYVLRKYWISHVEKI